MLKNYIRVLQEMYRQSQEIGIIMREKVLQQRITYEFNSEIKNPMQDADQNYANGIRAALIDLEKENLSLRALSESQQQEIQELIYQLEYLTNQLRNANHLQHTQQITLPNRKEDIEVETIRNHQYQEKLLTLNSHFQRKEQKMIRDIDELVNENTSLITKYNKLVDQLRQMQIALEQLSNENQYLLSQKSELEDILAVIKPEYDEIKAELRILDSSHIQSRLAHISSLEETLHATREQLLVSHNQIAQLKEQLNNAIIQTQKKPEPQPIPQPPQQTPVIQQVDTLPLQKLQEALLKSQSETDRIQQKYEAQLLDLDALKNKMAQLTAQLDAEKYLNKQLETKNNQQERQIMEAQFEKERLQTKNQDLETKLMSIFNEFKTDGSAIENQKRIQEARIANQDQQLTQLREYVNKLEFQKRDLELQIQRLTKDLEQAKERVGKMQTDHLNDIGELKKQLDLYYHKNEERYKVEKNLSNQKSKLEETVLSLNRVLIDKDKQLSLSLIERQQLQEQLKEKEIELDRARSRFGEADMLKSQLQYQISMLEQTKLRELELQRRIYDLENKNDDIQITHTKKSSSFQTMMI